MATSWSPDIAVPGSRLAPLIRTGQSSDTYYLEACIREPTVSQRRRSTRTQLPLSRDRTSRSGMRRMQLAFVIVSSLVICGMLGAAVVTISPEDLFGSTDSPDDGDAENFEDPNQGVIGEQQTVVASQPDDVEETLLLANLLGNSGRLGEAIPMYERAIDLAPDDAGVRLAFARALADGGMSADAELQFVKALELDSNNQEAHYYLAELYRAWTPPREAEAVVHYQRAAEIDPTTLISERATTQLASFGIASPTGSPAPATPPPA
ncbi:MAG: hypothetical protein AVDCRST_MAG43-2175 [uncultured Thermomicrobiales bacterium]|uniref:Uncharacterized protein n=1 Tax=uncultured Thermomicrobiales bacterium TaxID=1645740 RepID=A0A6J4UYL1_9BACT|nr:MAG: hypothetical protein AVDCRST_MAG43-2175 [uncultured Thermomicrobiales bacterium]